MSEAELPLRESSNALVQALYAELKKVASVERWRLGNAATLQTTALINETWLKLHKVDGWNDRQHFLRAAAIAMRQVLVDSPPNAVVAWRLIRFRLPNACQPDRMTK